MDMPELGWAPTRAAPSGLDRAQTLKLVETLSALRAAGDIDAMMPYLAEDVVLFPPTTWRGARFPVTLRGREAVRQALLERRVHYTFLPSVVHRVLIDGDTVVVHRTSRSMSRGGGETLSCDVIDIVRFRDSLIAEWCEFPDGATAERVAKFPL